MAKLSNLTPTLGSLPARVSTQRDAQGHDREGEPGRAWYSKVEWRRLRWRVLVRDRFTCQMAACGKLVADTSKLVADHVIPHRGDRALFFDETNLQTLCENCHASRKQAAERAWRG